MIKPIAAAPDLVEESYRAVRDAICDGRLGAGERVTQEQVAQQLGISRQPVVHAFARLKREGFLVDAGRKGVAVSRLAPEQVLALYEIRAELDALAASGAANLATDAQLRKLEQSLEAGRQAIARGKIAGVIDADMAFHRTLYAVSGNPYIEQTLGELWYHLRRAMGMVLAQQEVRSGLWDEHAEIVAAIVDRQPKQAAKIARNHANMAAQTLSKRMNALLDA
ncbi:MAG: putative HTH-type transcriptional regulator YdfH [Pseudomonadota bacterium]|jgi:DNA-binding GntR family transcriptional regulator